MPFFSPLRYPGGKGRLTAWMADLMRHNGLSGGWYVEPYAGGAGIAMNLLVSEHVNRIVINDIDPAIHAFWRSAIEFTDELIDRVMTVEITVEERDKQLAIYRASSRQSTVDLGFSVLFLNRTSLSGILTGGVIGGRKQTGKWKMDARFNRETLCNRLKLIRYLSSRIQLHCMDALVFMNDVVSEMPEKALIYIDPPYYHKGGRLYRNSYKAEDHARVADTVRRLDKPWVVTYDNCSEIRDIYRWANKTEFSLWYSSNKKSARREQEIMFWSETLELPCAPYVRR